MSKLYLPPPNPTPVDRGGTGQSSYTNAQILVGDTTGNTLAKKTLSGDLTMDKDGLTAIGALKVLTAMLNTSAATTPKLKPSVLDSAFTPQGANFTTTSTSYVDITGMSFTYTPGATNEKLLLWLYCVMSNSGNNNTFCALNVAGTAQDPAAYTSATTNLGMMVGPIIYNIAGGAGSTTFKLQAKVAAGTGTFITNTAALIPTVRGIAISNV